MQKCKQRIVVLGGSFNPPTIAHYRLMKEAVDALGADLGFFVPVSDDYLKRKMRHYQPSMVLSPELRVKMLQTMCSEDNRFRVYDKEIGTKGARTLQTMATLHEEYPNAELYFIFGADKLNLLAHLSEKWGFLDNYNAILYSRKNEELEKTLNEDDILANYLNRIVILPQPEGIEDVSSSLVRERIVSGESCQDLLSPEVWDMLKTAIF